MLAGSRSSPRRRSGSRGGPSQPSLDGVLAAALAALVVASALVGAVAPAVTAQSAPPAPVGAVAFTAGSTVAVPGANAGDTVVEVSFDADLAGTGATPAAGDFRVKVGPRLLTPVSVGGATDTDAQVVLNLGTTVDPWNVSRVNVTETADFEDTGGINAEFVVPEEGENVNMRVHERGVGETSSCGTGCIGAARACAETGRKSGWVAVHQPGGILRIETEKGYLEGATEAVYTGYYPDQFD